MFLIRDLAARRGGDSTPGKVSGVSVETAHKFECKVCPLNCAAARHPKMDPSGSDRPVVYLLGEAPGETEDREGEPFVGKSGDYLRERIPRSFRRDVRFGNCVRTWPGKGNPEPDPLAIEACRPSVVRDLEETKPKAIIGLGNVPLQWATGQAGISSWRGRRFPIKVGRHVCWFYPCFHPAFVLRKMGEREHLNKRHPSEEERNFDVDVARVFDEIERIPEAVVAEDYLDKIGIINGSGGAEHLDRLRVFLDRMMLLPRVAMDYETNSLRPYWLAQIGSNNKLEVRHTQRVRDFVPKILSVAIGTMKDGVMAAAMDHSRAGWSTANRERAKAMVNRFLHEYQGHIIVQNAAFEMEWTGVKFGWQLVQQIRWDDTYAQSYVLDERGKMHSLDTLSFLHFGFHLKQITKHLNKSELDRAPVDEVLRYNALDTKYTDGIFYRQREMMRADGLDDYTYTEQVRRTKMTTLTQLRGVMVDQQVSRDLDVSIGKEIDRIEAEMRADPAVAEFEQRFHLDFSPSKNDHVGMILADVLGFKDVRVKTEAGGTKFATDSKTTLPGIDHPLAHLTTEYRTAVKMRSTYVLPNIIPRDEREVEDGYGTVIYPDGLLHPQFNTNRVSTGRTSCDSPNLQNYPKRVKAKLYKRIRRQLIARPGNWLVSADYGQIEARVIAMLSKDKRFVQALWEDYDVHLEWAQRIGMAYPDRVGGDPKDAKAIKEFRGEVKNLFVFPAFYGAGLGTIVDYLRVPESVMRPILDQFWREFDGIREWQESVVNFYREHGYVITSYVTGRRRHAPISYNELINSPVQGTASDITVEAMCECSEYAAEVGDLRFQPIINVHDDNTCEYPDETMEDDVERLVGVMINRTYDFLNVPLQVEVAIGRRWDEMKEIGKFRSDQWKGR